MLAPGFREGHFFRHECLQLKLHPYSSTTLFEMDASYRIFYRQSANIFSPTIIQPIALG